MRISNTMIYDTNMRHMQTSLANYMESTIQGGTQKKINRPSDDPAGAALVLNTRTEIMATEQYENNVGTARSWLSTTDAALQTTSTTISAIITLAKQASTGTMSPENRTQISYQLEQMFGQLMDLSNTEVEGNSIFGGHNYTENAYEKGMSVMTRDEDFDTTGATVTGLAENSVTVHFLDDGVVGGAADIRYQWSADGGDTWTDATLAAGQTSLTAAGVTLNMKPGAEVKGAVDPDPSQELASTDGTFLYLYPTAVYNGDDNDPSAYGSVTKGHVAGMDVEVHADLPDNVLFSMAPPTTGTVDPPPVTPGTATGVQFSAPGSDVFYWTSSDNGNTWQQHSTTVPTPANGSINLTFTDGHNNSGYVTLNTQNVGNVDVPADFTMDMQSRRVDMLNGPTNISMNAQGIFTQNIVVRMDGTPDTAVPPGPNTPADLSVAGEPIYYSYSTDGGATWIKAVSQVPTPATGSATLAVPGGFLELSSQVGGGSELAAGTQMLIHPDRADLGFEVMENSYIPVNQVGKDIFGGMYNGEAVEGANLFDSVGKLIAYVENNESNGIAEMMVEINKALEHVGTQLAKVGGLENRLDLAEGMLDYEKIDQGERLSYTEDIDLTELLNNLAKDELAYSTVLQSSSMILQLNFTKFV